ncbi:MAG: hypothetical protein K5648_05400 [Erysipelotrichaceae bacterium]|nr:hypothetical protein [Erysipelotrichaceae bacterium]
MASISASIGVITLMFALLIYELDLLWLVLDLIGMVIAYLGLRKGDKNCRLGLILCCVAAFFCFSMICIIYFASK